MDFEHFNVSLVCFSITRNEAMALLALHARANILEIPLRQIVFHV